MTARLIAVLQLRLLGICVLVLAVLAVLVDFFEQARYLVGGRGELADIALLILYRLPSWLHLLFPVALLASACLAFALLNQHQELRALAAAGVGPGRMARPVLAVALLCAAVMFVWQELVVPPALDRLEPLMMSRFGRIDASWDFFRRHQWFAGQEGRLFFAAETGSEGTRLSRVTVWELSKRFSPRRRIDAERLERLDGGGWHALGVEERRFGDGEILAMERPAQRTFDFPETAETFRDLAGRPAQKTLPRLGADIEAMERRGLSSTEYRLAWHQRWAYPLLGMALLWLWFPALVVPWRRRTVSQALTESAALVLAGYLLLALCRSAVAGGRLAPGLGAWLPLAIVLLAAGAHWSWLLWGMKPGLRQ